MCSLNSKTSPASKNNVPIHHRAPDPERPDRSLISSPRHGVLSGNSMTKRCVVNAFIRHFHIFHITHLICPPPPPPKKKMCLGLLPTLILFNSIVFECFSVGSRKRIRTVAWTRIDRWVFRWHTFEHWCRQGFALSVFHSGNEYYTTIVYIPVSAFQTTVLPR